MGIINISSRAIDGDAISLPRHSWKDERLNDGSLMLASAVHSSMSAQQRQLLPEQGSIQLIDNIGWRQAAAIIGSGDAESLAARFLNNFLPADIAFERSVKLGIHGACSRANMSAGRSSVLSLPDLIKSYMLTNPRHRYYFALRGVITRKALYNGQALPLLSMIGGTTSDLFTMYLLGDDGGLERGSTQPAIAELLGAYASSRNQEGVPFLITSGSWRFLNNIPASNAGFQALLCIWGAHSNHATTAQNHASSHIFYDAVIEEGLNARRSYVDFEEQHREIFARDCAIGGPLHGDAWTPPASLIA